jgi:hypothetical protein
VLLFESISGALYVSHVCPQNRLKVQYTFLSMSVKADVAGRGKPLLLAGVETEATFDEIPIM